MRPRREKGSEEGFAGTLPGFADTPGERPGAVAEAGSQAASSAPEPLRVRPLAEYRPLFARTLLNESRNSRLPFFWTINPYRGCEFGCSYCFARYTHEFLDLPPEAFERKIYVKIGAGEILRETLKPGALKGKPVAIGTATDPYQPAEAHFGITRQILEVLAACPDLELSITTKSPLVLRDLDLLKDIARRRPLRVNISMTTDRRDLARILENHAPSPRRRLDTLRRLADAGIPTSVFVMPILPGITDDPRDLLRLLRQAREAGAEQASGGLLHLEVAARRIFWPLLRREFPELWDWYQKAYERGRLAPAGLRHEVEKRFSEARLQAGFDGSKPEVVYEPVAGQQLELSV